MCGWFDDETFQFIKTILHYIIIIQLNQIKYQVALKIHQRSLVRASSHLLSSFPFMSFSCLSISSCSTCRYLSPSITHHHVHSGLILVKSLLSIAFSHLGQLLPLLLLLHHHRPPLPSSSWLAQESSSNSPD